ncbi:MAG: hypothetical protein V5A39_05650 [Haloarculaceae archaeon]|jgi:hypothetical protein
MWRSDGRGDVTCIACGVEISRSKAREYDKHGDRWERREKDFEFLCKPCYRECCHQPRQGLEADLVSADAGTVDRETFLDQYHDVVNGESAEEHGRER